MITKIGIGFCMVALIGCCAGCCVMYQAPVEPPAGWMVSSFKAPLSTEGNIREGSKTGKATAINVIGLVTVGDCSLSEAMKNGELKTANYADYEYFNILGFYQRFTIIVTGE